MVVFSLLFFHIGLVHSGALARGSPVAHLGPQEFIQDCKSRDAASTSENLSVSKQTTLTNSMEDELEKGKENKIQI